MRPLKFFYGAVAILSFLMAGAALIKDYPEACMVYLLNAFWTFIGYRWHSVCLKQRELIDELINENDDLRTR